MCPMDVIVTIAKPQWLKTMCIPPMSDN
jgi:hypothetical protein